MLDPSAELNSVGSAVQPEASAARRDRPLVLVLQRVMPHFRRPVFERLCSLPEFNTYIVHSHERPQTDSGIAVEPLGRSKLVKMTSLGFGRFPCQWESLALVRQHNPDVVVCEASVNLPTMHLIGRLQARRGQGVVYWTKGYSPKQHGRFYTGLKDALARRLWRHATVALGYGESSRGWFERIGVPPDRIVIAQNTVDTSFLDDLDGWRQRAQAFRDAHGLHRRRVVALVSRLIPSKRADLLIKAAAQLTPRHPCLTVLIGGDGPERDRLRALSAQYAGLDVRFLGRLPVGEDSTVFAAADVNVFPGAVGLAIVQSMGLGRTTICANEPYADSELVQHERTGLRFERGNAQALAAQLDRVLTDSALAGRLGQAGHAHVRAHATIENMVERIADAIRLALKTRGRSGTGVTRRATEGVMP